MISIKGNNDATSIGLVVILVAALSWAAGNIVVKRCGKVNIIAFLAWSSIFAVPPLALMSYYYEGSVLISERLVSAPWHAWAIVLWQTLGNTLIGYGLWNLLLQRHATALVAPWALLVPVFGMAASSTFLDESMPWWKWIAATLIIAGLVINLRSTQSSPHSLKVR